MDLQVAAFPDGGTIPKTYTCDGLDHSPALTWDAPPRRTQAMAIFMEDPDAPAGLWTHWVIFNLSPNLRQLAERLPKAPTLPDGSKQGRNTWGRIGYNGPAPPPGKPHHYVFRLLALVEPLDLDGGATRAEVDAALRGKVLEEATYMGCYGR